MAPALTPGTVIAGRYRLEEMLGQGGMGQVWKAVHMVTSRRVALKLLSGAFGERPEMRRRFLQEARAASAVEHPNVVEIYDVFELDDTTPVMVMALLRGETLGQRLARDFALKLEDAADILLPVVSAAGTAHALGIIHRDLKPDNVFLASDGRHEVVKVLDFGIAKFSPGAAPAESAVTTTGRLLGTPCYMAPEQAFGEKDIDHRVDVWSIGAMLYEALVGRRAIDGENLGQIVRNLVSRVITPISMLMPDLPADVASLVMRMLTRERSGRPRDLQEVHQVLSRYARASAPEFGPPATPKPSEQPVVPTPPLEPIGNTSTHDDVGSAQTLESRIPVDSSDRGWSAQTPMSAATSLKALGSKRRSWVTALVAVFAVAAGLVFWRARVRVTPPLPTSHLALSADETPARLEVPPIAAVQSSPSSEGPSALVSPGPGPSASSSARAEASARRSATTSRPKSRTLPLDTTSPY